MSGRARAREADILIVGGGTGWTAAALAAASLGARVLMTEETDWIGGQLTAHCLAEGLEPHQVREDERRLEEFQALCVKQGFELEWPRATDG